MLREALSHTTTYDVSKGDEGHFFHKKSFWTLSHVYSTVSAGSFFTYLAYILPIYWQKHVVMRQTVTFVLA